MGKSHWIDFHSALFPVCSCTMNTAMLNTAVRAARNASSLIKRYMGRTDSLKIDQKHPNDFVTEVDKLSEQEIIGTLSEAYPDHAIYAEESGKHNTGDDDNKPTWIIDPLDGTTNFIHDIPQFAISIGMKAEGHLQVGVIYDPVRDELFTAMRGDGARLNNRKIRINPNTRLQGSLLGTGFPYYQYDHLDHYLAILKEVITKTSGVRRPGSAALDLAYTAAGRFDGFWEFNLQAWDIAAGALLVQEAGGIITDFNGEHDYMQTGDVLCGPPRVHQELLDIIRATA